ncbi:proto-oncogene tyrosine-protein kinase ROS [Brachyhypopomus gauderio]|uniref:proto-oncogene tyrosine-protein kinase ROS n=1 Tax=Brachyhypopomus gauderio TaxID=698409 RepID=UPI004041A870
MVENAPINGGENGLHVTKPSTVPSHPLIESIESVSGESVDISWSAPESPGGPIVGYNLNLTAHEHVVTTTTGENVFFTTFYPTHYNTTYRISIAAVNREGQGDVAEASLCTPPRPEQNGDQWVFASRLNSLRRRQAEADFFTPADCLADGLIQANITGLAVYHHSNHVYFSEGTRIWEKGADSLTDPSDLQLLYSASAEVTALSVDWLYRKLYYVSIGKVYYCKLDDCSSPVNFNLTLPSTPKQILADPYNGWLFLLLQNGIHRISLPEIFNHEEHLTLVVKSATISDFMVSSTTKRLLFYNQEKHMLSTVSLDGSLPVILMSEIYYNTLSIAYENGQLMITDGWAVYKETGKGPVALFTEFPMDCDILHSSYAGFGNLCFLSPFSQSYPLPRRPQDLQVVFGSDSATLHWNKPKITNGSSPSSWQNWTYSVSCSMNGTVVKDIIDITETHTSVTDLQSTVNYSFTVWANSPGGQSQTVSFHGTTLQAVEEAPYIVAASDGGFWKQTLDSFHFHESMDIHAKDVKDMDWYNDTLFWTDSAGHINWMDDHTSRPKVFTVPQALRADAVAFDWLGQYFYWSCNTSMICRGAMSGQQAELFLTAKQKVESLLIDSPNAAIYWTTETTVQTCRLDGERCELLKELSVFTGKKIVGVTADFSERNLYWLEQDGSFLNLYRAHINNVRPQDTKVTQMLKWSSSEVLNHQLAYYSGRLVWLGKEGQLRIQEVNQTRSVLLSSNVTLTAFALLQKSLKPLPDDFISPPLVIPPAVLKTSIRLEGNRSVFGIMWEPSAVEFGTVLYCVISHDLNLLKSHSDTTYCMKHCPTFNTFAKPFLQVKMFKPNTKFNIMITPYTYWGKGDSTFQVLFTPDRDTPTEANMEFILLGVTIITLIVGVASCIMWQRKKTPKIKIQNDLNCEGEVQSRGMVGVGNTCYAVSVLPIHQGTELLPAFPRECLRLQRLLGSGAFGEVYEGVMIKNQNTEERVAVKTLRHGASSQEKLEFLKEAQLMSQFHHPNILQLLGVCLLDEPHYLILELMEGGDLRSYLHGARSTATHGQLLNLTSLLDITLDVAKGCAYLEKIHFVHRDLATRNCLVSVREYADPDRLVKIGDFGLARDVYKNDYYRKRGEGLLPVRWMPPESLTDGIFNKHSDVWAFGVLLWEIVTLGKQPYPAFSNQEVLHHVSAGGRLPAPTGCPLILYNVMLECWRAMPTERPSFRCLQRTLAQLREAKTLSQDERNGHVNQAYQEEEEEPSEGVDTDEGVGTALTHVLSNEGLNYLMYQPDKAGHTDGIATDCSSLTEET